MNFLLWHYKIGIRILFARWIYTMAWIVHFFSLGLLLTSLFSPWKRLVDTSDEPGFSFDRWLTTISFNLISRLLGAIIRLFLFVIGTLSLIPVSIVGGISLLLWIVCPIVGLPYYVLAAQGKKKYLEKVQISLKENTKHGLELFFTSQTGNFFLTHLNVQAVDILNITNSKQIENIPINTLEAMITLLTQSDVWDKAELHKIGINTQDMIVAAKWCDKKFTDTSEEHVGKFSRPGIGLELLFGYTPTLNKYGTDLSVAQAFKHHLIGREEIVERMSGVLENNKAVLLYGVPGVGKKTVILEFAHRAMTGQLSPTMLYKRVVELDYNILLSQSLDISQKKVLLSNILREAMAAGNIVLVIKDIYRLTSPEIEGLDFTDIFESAFDSHKLQLIVLSGKEEYERFIAKDARLRKYMEPLEVLPPTIEQALDISIDYGIWWETQKKIIVTAQALTTTIADTDKYISDTPFPEKALEVLDDAISYCGSLKKTVVTAQDIQTVISQTTHISMSVLTQEQMSLLSNIENVMHERLIGQNAAVVGIAKTLRSRSLGLKSENRPQGSFLFLGPTGVGKTEAAKTLARVYYGSEENMIRFDMAEYAGVGGVEKLIGSTLQNQPGKLTTEVKNRPASLLLLDEIEKSPPEIYNLFLSVLDEGVFTDSFGRKINCKQTFVIATSNAGSEFIRQQVTNMVVGDELHRSVINHVQERGIFSPEFINRFDGVVVFEPLGHDETIKIATIMLQDLAKKLETQDITLKITPELSTAVATQGYEPEFGARPIRRIVDLEIGDTISKALLSKQVAAGDTVEIVPQADNSFIIQKI